MAYLDLQSELRTPTQNSTRQLYYRHCGKRVLERWSQDFGPVVKVDQLVKEVIQNEETKEPFARFQSQGCA
jgi:hypothetical protein